MHTEHVKEEGGRRHWENMPPGGDKRTYKTTLLTDGGPQNCPVEGCPGRAATRTAMQVHLLHWNVRDSVIIFEEGNLPHLRCPRCGILVPWITLNGRHLPNAQCARYSL